jgi:hypothetical protein
VELNLVLDGVMARTYLYRVDEANGSTWGFEVTCWDEGSREGDCEITQAAPEGRSRVLNRDPQDVIPQLVHAGARVVEVK